MTNLHIIMCLSVTWLIAFGKRVCACNLVHAVQCLYRAPHPFSEWLALCLVDLVVVGWWKNRHVSVWGSVDSNQGFSLTVGI